jgi:nucleotide-binding universal stress UspA family protein
MLSQPKILVCTDFSESSDRALKLAAQLAVKTNGSLQVLHVAEIKVYLDWTGVGIYNSSINQFSETLLTDLHKKMEAQIRRCAVVAQTQIMLGADVVYDILNEQSKNNYDLLVVGDKGAGAIKSFLLGSITRKLCAAATCPVLVVKDDKAISRVAGLIDGHKMSEKVINLSQELSFVLSTELEVISLFHQFPGIYDGQSMDYSSQVLHTIQGETELLKNKVEKKIRDAVKELKADIKVLKTHELNLGDHLVEVLQDDKVNLAVLQRSHKSSMDKLLVGSVASAVLEGFKGNILVV